jgi:hypothetical protein
MLCTKRDLYTKAVLTVIAFMLVIICCHQYVSPATTVKAEVPFAGVQFVANVNTDGFQAYDTRTGEFWFYGDSLDRKGFLKLETADKISTLGQPEIQLSVDQ